MGTAHSVQYWSKRKFINIIQGEQYTFKISHYLLFTLYFDKEIEQAISRYTKK